MALADAGSDHLPGSSILNGCQIPDGAAINQTTQIAAPDLMGLGAGHPLEEIVIGVMRRGNGAVMQDASSGWTQLELRHHSLSTLTVDAQMQRYPSMSIGWMFTVHRFDLLPEGLIFGRLLQGAVDVLAVDPQRCCTYRFNPGATDYLDFFCRCISSVSSPMSRLSSSFSRFSLL